MNLIDRMSRRTSTLWGGLLAGAALIALAACDGRAADHAAAPDGAPASAAASAKPALTVTATSPERADWPRVATANGNIAAWQEASVGTEVNGLRLAEVRVNVGDRVKRGQVLAVFAADTVQAELAQGQAAVAEAEATLAEAAANAQRARDLQTSGALSAQQIQQFLTAERTAQARLDAQRASARAQQLRLRQTQVLAPDDGVISARNATVGAVMPAGQELFRLIRQARLEWRAEVPSADLAALRAGLPARVSLPGGGVVVGKVRSVAPTVDPQTRNGLVYVELAAGSAARAGMFASGTFELARAPALVLPQAAVLLREGRQQVLVIGPDSRVRATNVQVGRRVGAQVEVLDGLDPAARVVASGAGFLADGDLVRVVAAPAPVQPAAPAAPAAKS